MLAACKAALSGLGQSGAGPGGRSSPGDKQVEAFVRSLTEGHLAQVAAHVAESRSLLVSPLKCHPARSSAWHLAAGAASCGGNGSSSNSSGSSNNSTDLLQLLLQLHREHDIPESVGDLINTPNKRGHTCLTCASARGNSGAVQLLLDLGADVARVDKSGRTALHHAAAGGSEECVRLLLAAAEAAEAAPRGSAAVAVTMAPASPQRGGDGDGGGGDGGGGDGSAPMSTSAAPSRSSSPQPQSGGQLQHQSQLQPPAVGTLLSRLVAAADVAGLTALHFAAAANSLGVVRLLLAAGAPYMAQAVTDNLEASMPCNAGWTCLHVAAMRGHYDVALMVLRFHSSLSTEDQVAGWTPGKHSRSSDPRALLDRRGSPAHALAASRGFSDLAVLLNPELPLSHTAAGGGPVGRDGQELRPPSWFVCPITQEVMREPVVASDGFTYERAAIARWIAGGKRTSPMTNLPFTSRTLYPNNVVKSAIKEWRQEHGLPDPESLVRGARRTGIVGFGLMQGAPAFDVNNNAGYGAGYSGGGGGGGGRDPFLTHLREHGL